MKKTVIVCVFNSPLDSGCDYVDQTMRLLAEKHHVYGIALGDVTSIWRALAQKNTWVFRRLHQYQVLRPLSFLPGLRSRFIKTLTYVFWAIFLRVYLSFRHPGTKKILWYFEPFYIPSLFSIFASYISVYDCVDYFPGFNAFARQQHDIVMKRSQHVFVNSKSLAQKFKTVRKDILTVPLGFARELFQGISVRSLPNNKKRFTAGFIGGISSRIDFPLLQSVVTQLPQINFLLIGPLEPGVFGQKDTVSKQMKNLLQYPNVRWQKKIPKAKIPAVMAKFDVGLIPYQPELSFNQYSFPMKTMEYFAAGKPVVSTPLAELKRLRKQGAVFISNNAEEFAHTLTTIQKTGWSRAQQKLQLDIAEHNSWQNKVKQIWKIVAAGAPLSEAAPN